MWRLPLEIYLPVCICLFVCLSHFVCLSVCLFSFLSVYINVCQHFFLSVCLIITFYLSIYLWLPPYLYIFLFLFLSFPRCLCSCCLSPQPSTLWLLHVKTTADRDTLTSYLFLPCVPHESRQWHSLTIKGITRNIHPVHLSSLMNGWKA